MLHDTNGVGTVTKAAVKVEMTETAANEISRR